MTVPRHRPAPTEGQDVGFSYPSRKLEKFMDEFLDFIDLLERHAGGIFGGMSESERYAAAAALFKSYRDWERETKRVRRRSRELDEDDY